jgi:hypothetical protein
MRPKHFDGFPYLLSNLSAGIFHISLLPTELDLDDLQWIARTQVAHNRFGSSLVLGTDSCYYFAPNGKVLHSNKAPSGGITFAGRLRLCRQVRVERARRLRLRDYIVQHGPDGAVFGDLSKGGRRATVDELDELAGEQDDGVPVGLERCDVCGDWRGECLDPDRKFSGLIMRVRCQCENDTRCARCGHPFGDRAVNANYFDGGTIWHVPGFTAFKHRCRVFRIGATDVRGSLISWHIDVSIEESDGRWLLHIRGEGYEDLLGPMDVPELIEQLDGRDYDMPEFIEGLRRFGEPKLNKLARQIEGVRTW